MHLTPHSNGGKKFRIDTTVPIWIPTLFAVLTASASLATPSAAQTTQTGGNNGGLQNGGNSTVRALQGLPAPLSLQSVPLPLELFDYVSDFDAAVRLGKAFFWDIQVGSDGMTACASCHWHAGADVRAKSQVAPGHDGIFQSLPTGAGGVNYTVSSGDFPFTERADPNDHESPLVRDINDRLTSSGIQHRQFTGVQPGVGQESGNVILDAPFHLNGSNVGRVEPRNSPTVINAIFNVRSFWDGRADQNFNGVNIWGARDPNARVVKKMPNGQLQYVSILIHRAALASQAVGPALSDFEMSYAGKDFKALAAKLLPARPLVDQVVDPTDLHLGALSDYPNRGMQPGLTYADMIRAAFHDTWHGGRQPFNGYSQMEHNFTLFWGLAILCYESQLVSNDTPFDRYSAGDLTAMTPQEIQGMQIFHSNNAACSRCHHGSEFAGATWTQVEEEGVVERMPTFASMAFDMASFTTLPDPTMNRLTVDPRGGDLEIRTPGGALVAYGTVPGTPGNCSEADLETFLIPGPAAPLPQVGTFGEWDFTAGVDVAVEGTPLPNGQCDVFMSVEMEWGNNPSLPAGVYPILLNGVQIGALNMGTAKPDGVYDVGYYNIGIRPWSEDIGIGGSGPFGPLSIVERLRLGDPLVQAYQPSPVVGTNEDTIVEGAFKTPTLRNISLTGPYFHNGGAGTLEQVVQFYARGADFMELNGHFLDLDVAGIGTLRNKPAKQAALIAFMRDALLDERVAKRSGKFCTPSLPLKDGYLGNELFTVDNGLGEAVPTINELPATGVLGGLAFKGFADGLAGGVNVVYDPNTNITEAVVLGCGEDAMPTEAESEVRIYLTSQPQDTVTIQLTVSDSTEIEVDPAQLVFTPDNWFHPQIVTVTGLDDGELDGSQVAELITSATTSNDSRYAGITVSDVQFSVADATQLAGQIYVDGSQTNAAPNGSQARPYSTIGAALICAPANATIHVASGVYHENVVVQGRKLTIEGTQAIIDGGLNGPCVTVLGVQSAGTILRGLTLVNGGGQNSQGGAVLVTDSSEATVDACVIRNSQGQSGGGIAARNSSKLHVLDSLIENNVGLQQGGGIAVDGGLLEVVNTTIRSNSTSQNGGGIHVQNGADLSLDGVIIENNTAGQFGGGLAFSNGQVLLNKVRVAFNSSNQNGAGIYAQNSPHVTAFGLKVANNTAQNGVGGLFVDGGLLDLSSTTLASNSGAQLHLMNSINLSIENSIIWGGGQASAISSNLQNLLPGVIEFSIIDWNGFAATGYSQADPLFQSPASGNHTPQAGSPAIDGGDPKQDDPDGSVIDMGAHPIVGN